MEFTEFLEHMEQVERGKEMLVYLTDQLRAFVPMPEPPPVIDPVLEQQWAEQFLDSLRPLWGLPEGVIITHQQEATAHCAPEVIVFNHAGEVIPA